MVRFHEWSENWNMAGQRRPDESLPVMRGVIFAPERDAAFKKSSHIRVFKVDVFQNLPRHDLMFHGVNRDLYLMKTRQVEHGLFHRAGNSQGGPAKGWIPSVTHP